MYRSAFWYWWRLKRRIRRLAVLAIRVGLVASLLLVSLSLLPEIWPEAGDEVRRFFAPVENTVRPVMERVAHRLGVKRQASRIEFGEVEVDDKAVALKADEPVSIRPSARVEMGALQARSGETGNGVRTAPPKAEGPIRIFRGNRVEVLPQSGKVNEAVQVFRGPEILSGLALAIDGDTLELDGVRVRLHGVDAPEYDQPCRSGGRRWPCGREARRALAARIHGRRVACEVRDRDSYGRVVATCSVARQDINAWMVANGWALAYRRYSRAYLAEESRARVAKRGVWRGDFVAPWKWREAQRR
ncbi:MAG: thermonuclease family protein [Deltaproteobacteria bacterium]|nr:thermonuclease family protein [Deltaproteobacteria bacterium]